MAASTRYMKAIALMSLVIQNSALVLLLRYSRTLPGPKYYSTTAVVLSELIKFIISLLVLIQTEHVTSLPHICSILFGPASLWRKLTYPAVLYMIQNNLQYVAAGLLDAATFQVTYQMKILTTALFSVILLRRKLNLVKWGSLILLTAGIALVQIPSNSTEKPDKTSEPVHVYDAAGMEPKKSLKNVGSMSHFLGLIIVGMACCLSGLAGVYFEKILKSPTSFQPRLVQTLSRKPAGSSLWVRNVQLSLFSILTGLVFGVGLAEGEAVRRDGFFYGYNRFTWMAILCQAVGGIIVALVVKYADNILKGFATSISIIISSVISVAVFDFSITTNFVFGAGMVIAATYMYSLPQGGLGTQAHHLHGPLSRKMRTSYRDMERPMVRGLGSRRRSALVVDMSSPGISMGMTAGRESGHTQVMCSSLASPPTAPQDPSVTTCGHQRSEPSHASIATSSLSTTFKA